MRPRVFWQELESRLALAIDAWRKPHLTFRKREREREICWLLPFSPPPLYCLCLSLVEQSQRLNDKAALKIHSAGVKTPQNGPQGKKSRDLQGVLTAHISRWESVFAKASQVEEFVEDTRKRKRNMVEELWATPPSLGRVSSCHFGSNHYLVTFWQCDLGQSSTFPSASFLQLL